MTAVEATSQAPQPGVPETSSTKPIDAAKVRKPLKLQEAKTLFSQTATGDPMATTAMRDVPRGVRAGQLCLTELREQLLNALPPIFPDLLPSFGLEGGSTTIEVLSTAFRADRQWYDLSYRCEVDTDAMKVMSFAFHVGDPVPPQRMEAPRAALAIEAEHVSCIVHRIWPSRCRRPRQTAARHARRDNLPPHSDKRIDAHDGCVLLAACQREA